MDEKSTDGVPTKPASSSLSHNFGTRKISRNSYYRNTATGFSTNQITDHVKSPKSMDMLYSPNHYKSISKKNVLDMMNDPVREFLPPPENTNTMYSYDKISRL